MKKLITILAFAIAIPSMVSAQGTVNFSSTSASHVIRQNGTAVASGFTTVALYGGSTADSLVLLGATVLNGGGGGVSGGLRAAPGVAGGTSGFFEVRAWTGGFASYEAAVAAALGGNAGLFGGKSGVFSNATGNPDGQPPTAPANLAGWTSPVGIVALPVPEPSTIALGILGAGSLLFLRRKK